MCNTGIWEVAGACCTAPTTPLNKVPVKPAPSVTEADHGSGHVFVRVTRHAIGSSRSLLPILSGHPVAKACNPADAAVPARQNQVETRHCLGRHVTQRINAQRRNQVAGENVAFRIDTGDQSYPHSRQRCAAHGRCIMEGQYRRVIRGLDTEEFQNVGPQRVFQHRMQTLLIRQVEARIDPGGQFRSAANDLGILDPSFTRLKKGDCFSEACAD